MSWAVSAYDHAETHYSLICVVPDARELKLCPLDDEIYKAFCDTFPNYKVDHLTEDAIKADEQKQVSFSQVVQN